ncbi:MAG: hypothetical protein VR66_19560 [Peptococcaceae bacterium BRH_c23]|nr:MAG: hypothetical protein VR66_19560 [Peptococcaceae bacterium BRH_c23]KJS89047.1 MAG: hypothetical protein JL57_09355 [Desulfosporosinus sp. BICA1-9]
MRFPLFLILFRERVKLFTLIMMFKLYFLRSFLFPETADLQIIVLELASVVIIFGLLELTKPRTILLWIVNFLLSTYFMASVIYDSYFGQIPNFQALLQLGLIKDLGSSIFELFSLAYLIFYFDFFLIVIQRNFLKVSKILLPLSYYRKALKLNMLLQPLACQRKSASVYHQKTIFITTSLAFVLTLLNIWLYPAKDNRMAMTRDVGFFNAQGYELYNYLGKSNAASSPSSQFSQAAINQLKQVKPVPWPKYFGAASDKNVILVQLESTQNFLVGLAVNNQEITPNLNQLVKESMYFPHFYSQIGQGNTSDAEFITNTSIYPLQTGSIANDYVDIDYPSLPRLLKKQAYTSVTFHPNVVTFWNRDKLYPCLGFDKYYDKEYYQDQDMLGLWGSSDEILYKKALPILIDHQKKNQKFYASLIALTNHHPYFLPESRKRVILPPQLEGTSIGNYLTSTNYQDYALGKFIEDLKSTDLWNNSIFIVLGDHFGITKAMEREYQDILTLLLGREHDAIDSLNVPFLIRVPGLKPQVIDTLGGQIDFLPTLANLLGIPLEKQITFGQDILNSEQNLLGFRFHHPDGTFITSNVFHLAGSNMGQNLDNRNSSKNQEFFLKEEQRIKSLLQLSDSYLQFLRQNKKYLNMNSNIIEKN